MTIGNKKAQNQRYYQAHKHEREAYHARDAERKRDPETRDIIAIDGEGISTGSYHYHIGEPYHKIIHTSKLLREYEGPVSIWRTQDHNYTLLCASNDTLIRDPAGLSTRECLDFILGLGKEDRTIIGYAFQYDVNMILRDLSKSRLENLYKYNTIYWRDYTLTWIPRKLFSIRKGDRHATVWDIFGYFQSRFVDALSEWNIGSVKILEAIDKMKKERGNFSKLNEGDIAAYCFEECRLCVQLFRKLLKCCYAVDIVPVRYDGAGSIATAILRRERVKEKLGYPEGMPEDVYLGAYYGGRFEMSRPGIYPHLFAYDINSAYPYALTQCPCFAHAKWNRDTYPTSKPYIARVRWDIGTMTYSSQPLEKIFGPFPVRDSGGSIFYPMMGEGYYWSTEIEAAIPMYPGLITILECWGLEPCPDGHMPFDFLRALYAERKALKERKDLGHLILKLGYNSIYGKTAQSIGGKRGKPPPFQNWLVASWTTALCRSMILEAVHLGNGNVVSIATDGILSTDSIPLPAGKDLGLWDRKMLKNPFLVRPNLYTYTEDSEDIVKCGGLAKKEVDINELRFMFIQKGPAAKMYVSLDRFVGLGTALARNALDTAWRRWANVKLAVSPAQHNRYIAREYDLADVPYTHLDTYPFMNVGENHPYTPKKSFKESREESDIDLMMVLDSID